MSSQKLDRMGQSAEASELALLIGSSSELFEGPPAGRDACRAKSASDWDSIGAALGEAGVTRLLRLLQAHPSATKIVLRISEGPDDSSHRSDPDGDALIQRLHVWCAASIASNRDIIRLSRRFGLWVLAICVGVLGFLLALAWALQQDSLFGPPGPIRTLGAEALVIAGWVVMWRPIELLVFDPMRPSFENRLLARVATMTIRVEWLGRPAAQSNKE